MPRRFDQYEVKRNDNLGDPEFWNRRFEDLDLRLAARELDGDRINTAVDRLTMVALARLNDTFTPLILEAQTRLANFGVGFSAASASSVAIGTGTRTFVLTPETRGPYVFIDYVSLRVVGDETKAMIGQVIGYDRETGALTVDSVLADGAGTYDDWIVTPSLRPDLTHATRTDNPHHTTAAQVGAYGVAAVDAMIDAIENAIDLLAPRRSPSFEDAPTAPTVAGTTDSSEKISTTAFVQAVVAARLAALLANTLGNDAAFAVTTATALGFRVRVDAGQSLSAAQQAQARANVAAAPIDALAYSGMQLNGAMEVSQEHGNSVVSTNAGYPVDGWQVNKSGPSAVAFQQVADAPAGLTNSIKITVTTAEASLGANSFVALLQKIEGIRTARLAFGSGNAQPVSIGFWCKTHRAGLYSGAVQNALTSRSYPFTWIQSAADTWQYQTLTIPGDVAGTWTGNTSGLGLTLILAMAMGSTFAGAAGAWASANYNGATGAVNGIAGATDVFQITGVIVLPGIELPPAARAPFIMRPFDEELILCQRQLWLSNPSAPTGASPGSLSGTTMNGATTALAGLVRFAVSMRASPTITIYNNGTASHVRRSDTGVDIALSSPSFNGLNPSGYAYLNNANILNAGSSYDYDAKADARL